MPKSGLIAPAEILRLTVSSARSGSEPENSKWSWLSALSPIRVAGDSGPLENELTWRDVQAYSRYPHPLAEFTTTTKRLRRVAGFDWEVVDAAIEANAPSHIALHGADYIDYENRSVQHYADLTPSARTFVQEIEDRTGIPVSFIGTGPTNEDIVDRRPGYPILGLSSQSTGSVQPLAHSIRG